MTNGTDNNLPEIFAKNCNECFDKSYKENENKNDVDTTADKSTMKERIDCEICRKEYYYYKNNYNIKRNNVEVCFE